MSSGPRLAGRWEPTVAQRRLRDEVARAFGIGPLALIGRSRKRPTVRARHAAAWVIKSHWPTLSWPQVAVLLGGRDHSTAMNAFERACVYRERDPEYRTVTDALLAGIPVTEPVKAVIPSYVKQRGAYKRDREAAPEPPPMTWCDQCQARVTDERAVGCRSRWCSVRGVDLARNPGKIAA